MTFPVEGESAASLRTWWRCSRVRALRFSVRPLKLVAYNEAELFLLGLAGVLRELLPCFAKAGYHRLVLRTTYRGVPTAYRSYRNAADLLDTVRSKLNFESLG